MNNLEIKKEIWTFLKNISIISFISSIIIFYNIIKDAAPGAAIIILFWPLIICICLIFLLSIITFILSIIKLKRIKKSKEDE